MKSIRVIAVGAILTSAIGGTVLAAQDRTSLKVPDGLAFSEFQGYDTWQPIAVSQTETGIKVIAGNDVMMKAFRDGLPTNGKTFPEGSKVAKIEWTIRQNTVSPYFVRIPGTLKSLSFIEKDSQRFPNNHGWAYAQFVNDPTTAALKPTGTGAECGYACHTRVASQDYIFTAYPPR
jgi:hypothetical protein